MEKFASALSFRGKVNFWGLWLAIPPDQQARSCGKAHSWWLGLEPAVQKELPSGLKEEPLPPLGSSE